MRRESGLMIREFHTRNYDVLIEALPAPDADLSWCEPEELERIRSGALDVFCVRVTVQHIACGIVAEEYLSGCVYADVREFEDHRKCGRENRRLASEGSAARCGSYFADMIREACNAARTRVDFNLAHN